MSLLLVSVLWLSLWGEAQEKVEPVDRGFISDRPGATDNPQTTPVGGARLELGVFSASTEKYSDKEDKDKTIGSFFAVFGTSENSELQFGVDGYKSVRSEEQIENDIGSLLLRYKYNLIGNDSGDLIAAVIPNLVHNGHFGESYIGGGLNIPIVYNLNETWSVSTMPEWDYLHSSDEDGISQYLLVFLVNYNFTDNLSAFIQHTNYYEEEGNTPALAGCGVAYQVFKKIQLDAEFNYGKNHSSETTRYSIGLVYEF